MAPIPKAVPACFHTRAISLDHLGVAEVAWKRSDVAEILAAIADSHWVVLGGDVLRSGRGEYRHTGDSWHSDRRNAESCLDFVRRSHHETIAYVGRYPEADQSVSYVLVFDECA
jgi:hypothetical protein